MHQLSWMVDYTTSGPIDFGTADLANIDYTGIYILWFGANPLPISQTTGGFNAAASANSCVVYVGQGLIRQRIDERRNEPQVLDLHNKHGLFLSWARVDDSQLRDGIERYLAEEYQPLIGQRHPDVAPVPVNVPWTKFGRLAR